MFFQENIYGNTAIVYHRTKVEDLINRIYTEGWKPKNGAMYGRGFYATYSLESQMREQMRSIYGPIVIKFVVHGIENFFIFDYDEFKKSPNYNKLGKPKNLLEALEKQFDYFKISIERYYIKIKSMADSIEKNEKYTSGLALWCYKSIPNFTNIVDGIIFTGEHDGKVLVSYRLHENIIPISFTVNEGNTWTKVPTNKEHLKKLLLTKATVTKQFKKERKELEDYGIINYKIDPDNGISVYQNFILSNINFKKNMLPFKLNVVEGNFICENCNLKTLKNAPREVYGDFSVQGNNLTSLEYCPEIVEGKFNVSFNEIKKIDYLPKFTNLSMQIIYLNHNSISYIKENIFEYRSPLIIKIEENLLESLDGMPSEIYSLYANKNNLIKIFNNNKNYFEYCLYDFNVSENKLESLDGTPPIIGNSLNISNNNLKNLKGLNRIKAKYYLFNNNPDLSINNVNPEDIPDSQSKFFCLSTKLNDELGKVNGYPCSKVKEKLLLIKKTK